jgi:ADP-ribosylglycohydrolase
LDVVVIPLGQYSDDSQLARELVVSIVDRGKFDAVDYAGRIAALFRENRIVGRGLATQAAADRLILGIPWYEAGAPPPSAGNGSAMRAGPVGLFSSTISTIWCERHTTKDASHTRIGVALLAQSRLLAL